MYVMTSIVHLGVILKDKEEVGSNEESLHAIKNILYTASYLAPAMTLPEHRAVQNAKFGHPQAGMGG